MDFPVELFINALIAGLLLGGFYAAVTVGISISFGILDIVNIAHPAFIILGSYIAYIVNARLGIDPRRVAWRVLGVVTAVTLLVGGWLGRGWQSEQRQLLGMDTSVPLPWLAAPLLGLLVAGLLLGVGRVVKWLGRTLFRPLGRVLPARLAWLIAVVVTAVVTWLVLSGLLIGNAISVADSLFAGSNDDDKPGVVNPQSETRSGGPTSVVPWDTIGREGRAFIASGPTAGEIERCRAQAEAHFIFRLQTVGGFGGKSDQLNAYNVFLGDPDYFDRDLDRYRSADADALRRAAAGWARASSPSRSNGRGRTAARGWCSTPSRRWSRSGTSATTPSISGATSSCSRRSSSPSTPT